MLLKEYQIQVKLLYVINLNKIIKFFNVDLLFLKTILKYEKKLNYSNFIEKKKFEEKFILLYKEYWKKNQI